MKTFLDGCGFLKIWTSLSYDGDGMFGVAPRSEWKGKLVIPPREAVGRIGSVKAEVRYNYQLMLDSSSKDEVYTIED